MNIEPKVLDILDRSQVEGAILRLPPGQLDRPTYVAVNKVIELAGGKWNKKSKGHLFEYDAADVIDGILLTGEVQNTKQDFGQFDSPPGVVARVVKLAEIKSGLSALEPSAGIGNLVDGAERAGASVTAYEVDAVRLHKAKDRCTLAGGIYLTNFLSVAAMPVFDRVVMNPPFAKQADVAHVMHAAKCLKPGGRLVSVMSPTWQTRGTKAAQEFREYLSGLNAVVVGLPEGSFKESGTGVNSLIVSFEV